MVIQRRPPSGPSEGEAINSQAKMRMFESQGVLGQSNIGFITRESRQKASYSTLFCPELRVPAPVVGFPHSSKIPHHSHPKAVTESFSPHDILRRMTRLKHFSPLAVSTQSGLSATVRHLERVLTLMLTAHTCNLGSWHFSHDGLVETFLGKVKTPSRSPRISDHLLLVVHPLGSQTACPKSISRRLAGRPLRWNAFGARKPPFLGLDLKKDQGMKWIWLWFYSMSHSISI